MGTDPFIISVKLGKKGKTKLKRRIFLSTAGAGAVAATLPADQSEVYAQDTYELRLVTSWVKNSPGAGTTAERLARRIETLSQGRIKIKLYAAGEFVGPFEVLDAVSRKTADLGHTASFFWQGKLPASVFFTAIPFGFTSTEHAAWIYHGGGQELWDELYATVNVKPFLGANSNIGMGGWFKKEINSLEDMQGLKYRMPGLGGEVIRRLGAVPVSLPPPDIAPSLHSNVIDAAEWLGPWSDLAMGFYKSATYYYGPGFHEPNGAGELIINLDLWNSLPSDLQFLIESACIAEHAYALSEIEQWNPPALKTLREEHGVKVGIFPRDVLDAARLATDEVLQELAQHDEITSRITNSFLEARDSFRGWSKYSLTAFLNARQG